MFLTKIFNILLSLFSVFCLAAGFMNKASTIFLGACCFNLILWILAYKWPLGWLNALSFIFGIGLSCVGMIWGACSLWMLLGGTFSLAGWVLTLLHQDCKNSSDPFLASKIEKKTILGLSAITSLGLLLIIPARLVQIQLPFWAIFLLIVIFAFCLDRVWRQVMS